MSNRADGRQLSWAALRGIGPAGLWDEAPSILENCLACSSSQHNGTWCRGPLELLRGARVAPLHLRAAAAFF
jgi:hypothetical protein